MNHMTFATLIGFMFVAFAGVGLTATIGELTRARASRDWPRALGKIHRSRVGEEWDEGPLYKPDIQFGYVVDGHEFRGTRIRFGGVWKHSWRFLVQSDLRDYPYGREVEVAYDPLDPSVAVLEPGSTRNAWGLILVLSLFAAVGIVMVAANYD